MKQQFAKAAVRVQRGFTLLELMVVVAIIGILVGIAVPTYQDSVRKSRRGQAKADLAEAAQAMERFYTMRNTYVGADLATIGAPTKSPQVGDTAHYTISLNGAPTASTFSLQAVPSASTGQSKDKCGTLGITNTGVKTPNDASLKECWNLN
ncbi:type IV pilin protein [Lysobacter sp. ESA13C]|uniref:type IV pilin protein n=1 Tax=Lysobacter sp. ESA13C TaxID=2862676 RepID=UPI001CBE6D7B|nr:type IV pilin protein [Lysobacter sp. ESA13C]